jgi:exopolyphosphatase / guanosine-5'-triphosphate,3'-diphosphate pyrophosphatase
VAQSTPNLPGRRLVVDIGGGSTECIIGERFEPLLADSLYMGCVSFTRRFFGDGALTEARMRRAETAALRELLTIRRGYREAGWDMCKGSSGTIQAIQELLRVNEWSLDAITPDGLRALRERLLACGHIRKLSLPALSATRAPVLPGGLAILTAVLESFGISRMLASAGALREGVLYDLLGRVRHEDIRDRTILRFVEHYHVDVEQAQRVEQTAHQLHRRVAAAWRLDEPELVRALSWAAQLHEIGLALSYRSYHKHGAYLVSNSDMTGFSTDDQILVAGLIRCHRRKLPEPLFEPKPFIGETRALRLGVCLRLAVLLNRGRNPEGVPEFDVDADEGGAILKFPRSWLDEHPLIRADLEAEQAELERVGIALAFA